MSDSERDKFVVDRLTLSDKGRRWLELIAEGLTPDEAERRAQAEIDAAARKPQ